ncbi:MAG: cytochrome b/b6 domain-containing protein [Candidatus Methanoperedens sp.]|nr:cytochrome b/b6 domain-containing protein [Candidatus Methanoperedens sp.]
MRVLRFDINSRFLHWSHAVFFIWLLITGISMFLTPKSLLGNPLLKMAHVYASLPFILVPILIYIFSGQKTREDIRDMKSWAGDDLKWFIEILKNNKTHVAGKFNGGQKANFFLTLLLIIGLSLSGFIIWMKSMFSVNFVEFSFIVHDFLAEISIFLLAGHVIFTLFNIESLRGIINGEVNSEWAKKHYPDWFLKKSGS